MSVSDPWALIQELVGRLGDASRGSHWLAPWTGVFVGCCTGRVLSLPLYPALQTPWPGSQSPLWSQCPLCPCQIASLFPAHREPQWAPQSFAKGPRPLVCPQSRQPAIPQVPASLGRFHSSKSGKIYLHDDIRLLFSRKSIEIDSGIPYELKSFTELPRNPCYSPRT